jgi:hypothetical protein
LIEEILFFGKIMDLELGGRSWQKLIYDIAGDDNRDFVTLAFGWKKRSFRIGFE